MNIKRAGKILVLMSVMSVTFGSCVMDHMPLGYCFKNCTNDTLLAELTMSDTLEGWMFWGEHSKDTFALHPDDTTEVYIHGEKVIISNYYISLPDSISGCFYPFNKDTCYLYVVSWQVATHYLPEEIRKKKLYCRYAVAKKDFHNHLFEYKPTDAVGGR